MIFLQHICIGFLGNQFIHVRHTSTLAKALSVSLAYHLVLLHILVTYVLLLNGSDQLITLLMCPQQGSTILIGNLAFLISFILQFFSWESGIAGTKITFSYPSPLNQVLCLWHHSHACSCILHTLLTCTMVLSPLVSNCTRWSKAAKADTLPLPGNTYFNHRTGGGTCIYYDQQFSREALSYIWEKFLAVLACVLFSCTFMVKVT